MKQDKLILLLTLTLFTLSPVQAIDLDDFVPADGEVVNTTLISNGAVTSEKIADAAITAAKLGTEAVTAAAIANNAVTSIKIQDGTITAADLAADSIDGSKIGNGSITGIDLANDTITATQIAADAIGSSELAADSVTASEIATDAVGSAEIVADAIGASEIAADAVGSSEIVADAVGSSEIATDAVGASEIAAGAVANSELAANAVTTDKIQDGTITAADLAAGVISSTGTKYSQVDIGSGIRTSLTIGTVGAGYGAAPVLRYDSSNTSYSRWTFPVPDDYIAGTDIIVELLWSPSNTNAGNVVWEVDYASLAAGEIVPGSAGFTAKTFTQASPGTTLALSSTGNNITLSAADLAADDVVNLVVLRDPNVVADTYNNDANIHLIKLKYQAKKVN